MRWQVVLSSEEIFPGLEFDFMERPEIGGTPQPHLEVGDEVWVQQIGSGAHMGGQVTSATASELVIDFGSERWRFTPRESRDFYSPTQTTMRLRTWFARERI